MLPHTCGSASTRLPFDECWRFMASSNSWEMATDEISRDINRAAHAFHEDWGIIMAGGRENDGDCCSYNVTYTTSGTDFKDIVPLPDSTIYFCVAGINSSHIFVTGLGKDEKDTYMYSTWTNKWEQLPSMPTGRRYAGCEAIRFEDLNYIISITHIKTGNEFLNTIFNWWVLQITRSHKFKIP